MPKLVKNVNFHAQYMSMCNNSFVIRQVLLTTDIVHYSLARNGVADRKRCRSHYYQVLRQRFVIFDVWLTFEPHLDFSTY